MLRAIVSTGFVLAILLRGHVAAQTFENGRAPLIAGQTQDVAIDLSLVDGRLGGRTAIVQGLPTATMVKLRLDYVGGQNLLPGAIIVIRDAGNNEVTRYTGETLVEQRQIWTPLIRGTAARVELVGPTQPGGEFRAQIRSVASYVPPSKPTLNIVREFDLEDMEYIRVNQPDIFNAGRPVAKIAFVSSKGPAACTGFLISDDRMLTNYHCITTEDICKSADIIFGFDTSALPLGEEMQRCSHLIDKDEELDAALIDVSGSPGKRWGSLAFSDVSPVLHEAAVVVQHPAGFHKFVSRKDCVVSTMPADGIKNGDGSDFGHSCDTMDGSSGSPVLRRVDLKVIGLHHWGFDEKDPNWSAENRAVQIQRVKSRFGL